MWRGAARAARPPRSGCALKRSAMASVTLADQRQHDHLRAADVEQRLPDDRARRRARGPATSAAASPARRSMRCETSTPFGRPVVPEVYMMAKGASRRRTRRPGSQRVALLGRRRQAPARRHRCAPQIAAPQAEMAGSRSVSATMRRGSACAQNVGQIVADGLGVDGNPNRSPCARSRTSGQSAVSPLRSISATRSPGLTPLARSQAAEPRRGRVERAKGQRLRADPREQALRRSRCMARRRASTKPSSVSGSQVLTSRRTRRHEAAQALPCASARALRRAARSAKNTRIAACGSPEANASAW